MSSPHEQEANLETAFYHTLDRHEAAWAGRLVLLKLLSEIKPDWTAYGVKLWAERELEAMDV